jgi:hypothetical protein
MFAGSQCKFKDWYNISPWANWEALDCSKKKPRKVVPGLKSTFLEGGGDKRRIS